MAALRERVRRLLQVQSESGRLPALLIQGETGTGKGLLARAIHRAGPRAAGPFQAINCAALPEHLVESELFGFERGAFTDARQAKPGLFQTASGGTLFLDEVGLLPEAAQAKVLTAIEQRSVRRLGGTRSEHVDVRIIAATNADLMQAVSERRFREDLYHRLAVVSLVLPPLRERGEDIELLARQFLETACRDYGVPAKQLLPEARQRLRSHPWRGNVRELANVMERVALLGEGTAVSARMLGLEGSGTPSRASAAATTPPASLEAAMESGLLAALEENGWNISRVARQLGITRNTVRARIARHGLKPGVPPSRRQAASQEEPAALRPETAPAASPARPEAPPAPRRWVTRRVTFLRVATATEAGSEAYDASDLLDKIVEKVEIFGGQVDGVSPAELTAVFGVEPMEDAPDRAGHAALAIAKAVERARTDDPSAPSARLAIHLEQVQVLQGRGAGTLDEEGRRRTMLRLDALVAATGRGEIVVSDAAAAFLARRFKLVRHDGPAPDGTLLHALVGRGLGFAGHGRTTPFVGRQEELDLLGSRLQRAREGRGQVVGIVGEAGLGKSRLLDEWRRSLTGSGIRFLEGRCHSHGASLPFLPVLEIIRRAFRIGESDSREEIAQKTWAALQGLELPAEEMAPYLLHLLGTPGHAEALAGQSPEAIHARTLEILRLVSVKASALRPIVMVIEDLHWIDHASAAYVAALIESLAGARIMLVTTYRQEYRPPWLQRSYVTQMPLQPLSPEESRRALQSVLAGETVAPGVEEIILARAEGNPFFLEELARTLTPPQGGAPTEVPGTVQEVLLARLERLAADEREMLQAASVLGRDFSPSLLQAMTGGGPVRPRLAPLIDAEFLYEAAAGAETLFVFRHALTQHVAYESLLPARRQALHAGAARALEAAHAGRLDDALDQIAFHYGASDVRDKAVHYLTRCAARSAARYANVEAATLLEQALAHAERLPAGPEADRAVLGLVFRQAHALGLLGQFQKILERLVTEAPRVARLDDAELSARYYFWLGRTFSIIGQRARATESGRRSLAEAERAGNEELIGSAQYVLAYECYWAGQLAEGVRYAREAVLHLEQGGDRYWLAMGYWVLALNNGPMGEWEASLGALAKMEAIADATSDPKLQSAAAWTAGSVHGLRGDWERGVEIARRGLAQSPNPLNTALAMGFLGAIYFEKGDTQETIPLLEKAVEQMSAFKTWDMQGWLTAVLGEALVQAGETGRGRATLEEALTLSRKAGYWWGIGWAQRALGRLALAEGTLEEAHQRMTEALGVMEGAGARFEVARTRLALAQIEHARGSRDAAASHLLEAARVFAATDSPVYVARVEATARALGLPLP